MHYQIWDKKTNVRTPIGEVLTPEQWIKRFPWAGETEAVVVIAKGFLNGSYIGELSVMRSQAEDAGADFSAATTNEEVLAAIEDFEAAQRTAEPGVSIEERTAAALEIIAISSLPDSK